MSLVFGKYKKIRRIAHGGMGEVFLARQSGVLDRLAILKCLRSDLAQEPEFVEQFLDEARVAATLNHPNIVSIYDVGDWKDTFYIAMEYVPGEDLSKLWYAAAKAGVGLPFQVSVRICYEAALGLDHAHKAKDVRGSALNIVHRDVSPQNIMVRGDGVVKLVDFGIAKAANKASRTQAGMVKGKLQYMSPEQVRGEGLDGRSDQFSLGVVLWEMCTGRRLFKADNEINTIHKIVHTPIPRPSTHVPGFPAELEVTIMRMLNREMDQRFKSLAEVCVDLKAYLDRAAIQNGEVTVSSFVQQILGDALEERTRDLTPMENTDVSESDVQTTAKAGQGQGSKVTPKKAVRQRGMLKTGEGQKPFADMSALQRMILDGEVSPDDAYSFDGAAFVKLSDNPDLERFLEIAKASEVLKHRAAVLRGDVTAIAEPPPTIGDVTRVVPDGEASQQPPTIKAGPVRVDAAQMELAPLSSGALSSGAVSSGAVSSGKGLGPTEAGSELDGVQADERFSLGALPQGETGQWRAVADPNAAVAPENDDDDMPVKRASTGALILLGVVSALVAVLVAVYVAAPQAFADVFASGPDRAAIESKKALVAARQDDPAAIDALLATLQPLLAKSNDADVVAGTALLLTRRAHILADAASLAEMASRMGQTGLSVPDAEPVRGEAYKAASAARSKKDSAWSALAMAAYQADKGARAEFHNEAARVRQGDSTRDMTEELVWLERQLKMTEAMRNNDLPGLVALADSLKDGLRDARTQHALTVVLLAQATATPAAAREALLARVTPLVDAMRDTASSDPRAAPAIALLRALREQATNAKAAATDVPVTPPVVRAPDPAAALPATAASAPAVSASPTPTPVAVEPAKPEEPTTYAQWMERGRALSKGGRYAVALKAFMAAEKLQPDDATALLGMGWSLLGQGLHDKAEARFRAAIASQGDLADAHFGLGEALKAQNKTEDAKAAFQKYLELAPTGRSASDAENAIRQLE